ncbi:hypothetical protein U9M48_038384 [Paspalum notatum var. saurae]|uniref:Uncharacterized protein n=1 Tax=Paspalum notatum var. saurae TaxID=547442 RepID=A0AAQ3XDH8_PASNO
MGSKPKQQQRGGTVPPPLPPLPLPFPNPSFLADDDRLPPAAPSLSSTPHAGRRLRSDPPHGIFCWMMWCCARDSVHFALL